MKLVEGQIAPNFTAVDIDGNKVQLSDYRGTKIVIGFFRNVNCPFCNRRVHQVMNLSRRLKETGTQLLFLFESSSDKLKASTFHQGISPWPLIGDPQKVIYNQYGLESSALKMIKTMFVSSVSKAKKDTELFNLPQDKDATMALIPADFFIDEQFKIVKAHYGSHLDDHVSIDELRTFAGISNVFAKK